MHPVLSKDDNSDCAEANGDHNLKDSEDGGYLGHHLVCLLHFINVRQVCLS